MTPREQQIEKLLRIIEIYDDGICPCCYGDIRRGQGHDPEINCPVDQALTILRQPTRKDKPAPCPNCLAKDLIISNLETVVEEKDRTIAKLIKGNLLRQPTRQDKPKENNA